MEKNDGSIDSMSGLKSKSVPAAGDFHCSSTDLTKTFMPVENVKHGKDNDISNNNNVDDDNRDDIGCVHYKRRAKFVVSNAPALLSVSLLSYVYPVPISHEYYIAHSNLNLTNLSLLINICSTC